MYNHPDNKVTVGEEAAAPITSSLPRISPDNEPISASWSSDEDDLNTSPILKSGLSSSPNDNDDSLASSPPPFLSFSSPSPGQKKEHVLSGLPLENPFSSTYNAPPRPAKNIRSFPSPAATPTPLPRSGRSSELTSARIAAYEARTAEAAARATTGTIFANLESQSPPIDEAAKLSSVSQPPNGFYNDATQQSPESLSDSANKPNQSKKPRTARYTSLSARPTAKPNQQTLEGENDKGSSSVSSQVSSFADFYVAATDKFPGLSDDGALEPDRPQENQVSSGPSARRSGIVLGELEEEVIRGKDNDLAIADDDEEEEEWWEMEDEDERKPRLRSLSHFQIGGENDMTAFPVGALSSRQGHSTIPGSRFSFVSDAPSVLDLSDAQWEEDSRLYWEDACAELNEVADSVLAANEDGKFVSHAILLPNLHGSWLDTDKRL
jgi:hypothetical protein